MESKTKKVRRLAKVPEEIDDQVLALVKSAKEHGVKRNTIMEIVRKAVEAEYAPEQKGVKKKGRRAPGARDPLCLRLFWEDAEMVDQKIELVKQKLEIKTERDHWIPKNWNTVRKRPQEKMGKKIKTKHKDVPSNMLWTYIMCFSVKKYPTAPNQMCSHLCHTKTCCNPHHLHWEDENQNKARESCSLAGECKCNLLPACIFPVINQ